MNTRGWVLSIVNQKGGVGKTTTAINLALGLSRLGDCTLLIDADAQSNATSGLGITPSAYEKDLFDLLQGETSPEEVLCDSGRENLWLIPASVDLARLDELMATRIARESVLKRAIEPLRERFRWIVIDAPPSLGMMTINALTASDGVIVPLQCEYYALEGITQLMVTIDLVRQHLNPELAIWKVLLTMYDSRTRLSEQVEGEVRKFFGTKVAKTVIPRNVRVSESPSFGLSVIEYDPRSKGAKAYWDFVKEVHAYGTTQSR